MSVSEGLYQDDIVLYEPPMDYARKLVTIAASQTISRGEILELSGSDYIAVATAGNAVAIALEAVTTTGATATIVALVRNCVVKYEGLTYNSLTEATVNAALEAKGIVVRTGPTYTTAP